MNLPHRNTVFHSEIGSAPLQSRDLTMLSPWLLDDRSDPWSSLGGCAPWRSSEWYIEHQSTGIFGFFHAAEALQVDDSSKSPTNSSGSRQARRPDLWILWFLVSPRRTKGQWTVTRLGVRSRAVCVIRIASEALVHRRSNKLHHYCFNEIDACRVLEM